MLHLESNIYIKKAWHSDDISNLIMITSLPTQASIGLQFFVYSLYFGRAAIIYSLPLTVLMSTGLCNHHHHPSQIYLSNWLFPPNTIKLEVECTGNLDVFANMVSKYWDSHKVSWGKLSWTSQVKKGAMWVNSDARPNCEPPQPSPSFKLGVTETWYQLLLLGCPLILNPCRCYSVTTALFPIESQSLSI